MAPKINNIDLICFLLKPTQGDLLIDDTKIGYDNYKNYQKIISYIPQSSFFINDTVLIIFCYLI